MVKQRYKQKTRYMPAERHCDLVSTQNQTTRFVRADKPNSWIGVGRCSKGPKLGLDGLPHLEESLHPAARVLRPLAVVPVGEQHRQAALPQPLVLAR